MIARRDCIVGFVALTLIFGSRHNESLATDAARVAHSMADDACALLSEEQVSAAIEVKTLPGQHLLPVSTRQCIWSEDPKPNTDHRRVTLNITTVRSFTIGKSNPGLTIEPVTGVGDDAYYIIFRADAPTLVVRKGEASFDLRLLNGSKAKALSIDELKARELTLAKAAVGKL